jgi:hypothetical protein
VGPAAGGGRSGGAAGGREGWGRGGRGRGGLGFGQGGGERAEGHGDGGGHGWWWCRAAGRGEKSGRDGDKRSEDFEDKRAQWRRTPTRTPPIFSPSFPSVLSDVDGLGCGGSDEQFPSQTCVIFLF